jgi:hypothetical protein
MRNRFREKTVEYNIMPDYQRSKVYKITSGDLTYIGSTTSLTLSKRLAEHVSDCKRWKKGTRRFTSSFTLIETGQYEITLVELCPCNSKDELTARERYWIENIPCVNKFIPGRTDHEWYEANKEYLIEKQKVYREANKIDILKKAKEYREANAEKQKTYNIRRRELYKLKNLNV